jgi:hypothetical protein
VLASAGRKTIDDGLTWNFSGLDFMLTRAEKTSSFN